MDTLSAFEFCRVILGLLTIWKCYLGVRRTSGDVGGALGWRPREAGELVERQRRLIRMRAMNRRYHRYGIGATGLLLAGTFAAFSPNGPDTALASTSNIAQILALGMFFLLADDDEDQRQSILGLRAAQGLSTDDPPPSAADADREEGG